jgi:guanylate kinase
LRNTSSASSNSPAAARDELAAAGEFDVLLVNTSVEEVCRQMVMLITDDQ